MCTVEFVDGIEHGDDVFDRGSGLHVMNRIEDKTAPGGEDFATAQDLFADFGRGAEGENFLGVDSAAPENELLPECGLELLRLHAGGGALHGVDDVNSDFDKGGQELGNRSAGMLEDLPRGAGVDPFAKRSEEHTSELQSQS